MELKMNYSGTLPDNHPVNTAILFWPKQKLSQSFSYLKNPVNLVTPIIQLDFCGLLVTEFLVTGFHCIYFSCY